MRAHGAQRRGDVVVVDRGVERRVEAGDDGVIRIAALDGCEVDVLGYAWGETPSPEDLARRLSELDPVSIVVLVHSETSTGVVADLQALAAPAKDAGALVLVDAVSSLGAVPLETDDWGLDVVVSGSQKALMTPPGLGTVAVSPAALEHAAGATLLELPGRRMWPIGLIFGAMFAIFAGVAWTVLTGISGRSVGDVFDVLPA